MLIKFYAGMRFAVYKGVLINDIKNWTGVEDLELIPKNPKQEMSLEEFEGEEFFQKKIDVAILEFWIAVTRKEFEVPQFIGVYMFYNRKQIFSPDIIYRDLRWYLLKHPIKGNNLKLSPKRSAHIVPKQEDFVQEYLKLIQIAKAMKENPDLG